MSKFTLNHVSRRAKRTFMGLSSLCVACVLPLTATAQDYNVDINKSQMLRLPAAASAIVVGNPLIADVTVHSPDTLFIVARGFGETNVIVLDEFGATMLDANIHVNLGRGASSKRVFHDQAGWRTYDCNPFCNPAPTLGDEIAHKVAFIPQVQPIDNTATPIRSTQPVNGQSTPGALSSTVPQFDDYSPNDGSNSMNPRASNPSQPRSNGPGRSAR